MRATHVALQAAAAKGRQLMAERVPPLQMASSCPHSGGVVDASAGAADTEDGEDAEAQGQDGTDAGSTAASNVWFNGGDDGPNSDMDDGLEGIPENAEAQGAEQSNAGDPVATDGQGGSVEQGVHAEDGRGGAGGAVPAAGSVAPSGNPRQLVTLMCDGVAAAMEREAWWARLRQAAVDGPWPPPQATIRALLPRLFADGILNKRRGV